MPACMYQNRHWLFDEAQLQELRYCTHESCVAVCCVEPAVFIYRVLRSNVTKRSEQRLAKRRHLSSPGPSGSGAASPDPSDATDALKLASIRSPGVAAMDMDARSASAMDSAQGLSIEDEALLLAYHQNNVFTVAGRLKLPEEVAVCLILCSSMR